MLFSRNIVSTIRSPVVNAVFKRTVVSTPPRVRMPFAEKVAHGVLITIATLAIPMYISTNLKHYKGDAEE